MVKRMDLRCTVDRVATADTMLTLMPLPQSCGLGSFSLEDEPVVAQVPDFGDRFWTYALFDARTDQIGIWASLTARLLPSGWPEMERPEA